MCLPDGKRIGFHLIRRASATPSTQGEGIFSEAHLHCADTVIAVARPETADETATNGTDKYVPYERPLAAAES